MNGRELREFFQPGRARFIALLDDPAMREAAFSAGDDACLLLPLVTPEVRALLCPSAESASATNGLPANLIREATETAGPVGSLCGRWIDRLRDLAGAKAGWALVQEPGGREPIPLLPVAANASATAEDTSETLPRRLYEQLRDSAPATTSVHAVGGSDAPRGLLGRDCGYVTAIPLRLSQSFLGLVFLEHTSQSAYTSAQLEQLAALGGCLSLALGTEFLCVQSKDP